MNIANGFEFRFFLLGVIIITCVRVDNMAQMCMLSTNINSYAFSRAVVTNETLERFDGITMHSVLRVS